MWACDPGLTATVLDSYQAAGPLFIQGLQTFLAAQCALAGEHIWPPDATDAVIEDPNYDFIVVGAGSAGAVVANRLSEVPEWKVLLVEAGGNPTIGNEMPLLFHNNLGTPGDWQYKTEPQEGSCRGYRNNGCVFPRGKVLGGSSSINGMFYVRGNKLDYDEWAADGNKGWSYEEVLPYFMKSENFSGEMTEEYKKYHSNKGYLSVESHTDLHDLEKAIIQAANELGLKYTADVNGEMQMGVAASPVTMQNGVRHSTARAFLSPIKDRNNFHVIKNAQVTKILFQSDSNIVDGVIINKNGKDIIVKAKKEVIISAGAVGTPQLLLLSGIGPSKDLQDMGIKVKADLPAGENLQDHPSVVFLYATEGDTSVNTFENISKMFGLYLTTHKGPFSNTSPHRVIAFYNTTDAKAESPDMQFHYLVFPPSLYNVVDMFDKHDFNEEVQSKFRELNKDKTVAIVYAVLLRPKSKGKIVLKSNDPNEHPLIYPNYFDNPEDLNTIKKSFRQQISKLEGTKAFKELGLKLEWLDLDECKNYQKDSDEFLDCYSRIMTLPIYHPVGTAKMGSSNDNTAVVDPELRVRNVERLRVIDASIMPDIVRGNTNAPTIMIGEKGADMIKKTWLNAHTEL